MRYYFAAVWFFVFVFNSSVMADDHKPVVVFDQGHGQKFVIDREGDFQLSKFAGLFREQGYEIKINTGKITEQTLEKTDVIVISGPFNEITAEEQNSLAGFMDKGGRLCLMLHIPHPAAGLMEKLNVYASNGVVQEQENIIGKEPKDFNIIKVEQHPVMKGISKFSVYGSWAVMSDTASGKIIAWTSPKAWIDLNRDGKFGETDAMQSFGIAIAGNSGKGRYIIFGDDAIFQNRFLDGGNLQLGRNLSEWLR